MRRLDSRFGRLSALGALLAIAGCGDLAGDPANRQRSPAVARAAGSVPARETGPANLHAANPRRPVDHEAYADDVLMSWGLHADPDPAIRLYALEAWALHPGSTLDPVTYALVDADESVRARAQEVFEEVLARW